MIEIIAYLAFALVVSAFALTALNLLKSRYGKER